MTDIPETLRKTKTAFDNGGGPRERAVIIVFPKTNAEIEKYRTRERKPDYTEQAIITREALMNPKHEQYEEFRVLSQGAFNRRHSVNDSRAYDRAKLTDLFRSELKAQGFRVLATLKPPSLWKWYVRSLPRELVKELSAKAQQAAE